MRAVVDAPRERTHARHVCICIGDIAWSFYSERACSEIELFSFIFARLVE
jgi:hypothetical protein